MPPGGNLKGQWIAPSFIASVQSVAAAQDRMNDKPSARRQRVEQFDAYKAQVLAKYGLHPEEWSLFCKLRIGRGQPGAANAARMVRERRPDGAA